MDWLIEPFRYAFMQHALVAALLVGITFAMLGVHVVQRRMAFVGDALAHTTLPGLVVAHLFGLSLSLGGLAAALVTALLIGGYCVYMFQRIFYTLSPMNNFKSPCLSPFSSC